MVVRPNDEDRGEARDERQTAGPKCSQETCQSLRRDQIMARHLDLIYKQRHRDRQDPVAESPNTHRFISFAPMHALRLPR
jgi:hypothetical protein